MGILLNMSLHQLSLAKPAAFFKGFIRLASRDRARQLNKSDISSYGRPKKFRLKKMPLTWRPWGGQKLPCPGSQLLEKEKTHEKSRH